MGGDIIAERFSLLKTRGSNGVAFTYIVEDTLDGRRLVLKVSDRLGILGLEYHKACNLLSECGVRGILLPMEGGILDEDGGYYLAFPELGEPSLENYVRMRHALTCEEILHILERLLAALDDLHRAGFVHLFLEPRNIFYLPRREITLKDPALRPEFFHDLLELVSSPDYSYLPPVVMDGGFPGPEADVYAVGRLAEKLLERASDGGSSPLFEVVQLFAKACTGCVMEEERPRAAQLRERLLAGAEAARSGPRSEIHDYSEEGYSELYLDTDDESVFGAGSSDHGERAVHKGESDVVNLRRKHVWLRFPRYRTTSKRDTKAIKRAALTILSVFVVLGIVLFMVAGSGRGQTSAAFRSGGSELGGGATAQGVREMRSLYLEDEPGVETRGEVTDSCAAESDGTGGAVSAALEVTGKGSGMAEGDDLEEVNRGGQMNAPENRPPIATFTVSPSEGESPLSVLLDASGSYDPDGHIVSYQWSCGGSEVIFRHVFESNIIPVRLAVTLTVTDDAGASAKTTRYITLY